MNLVKVDKQLSTFSASMKEGFFEYLEHEKRYSTHTLTAYRTDIGQIERYLLNQEIDTPLVDIQSFVIRNWVVHLLESDISARSIGRKLSTLKSFFKYLKRQGLRADNPMQAIISPKTSKRLPEFVEQRKMEGLFEQAGLFEEDFAGQRDRLIIHLFYMTGLRSAELIGLQESSYDSALGSLKVIGKRNKERIVPLGVAALSHIDDYLKSKSSLGFHSPSLFVRDNGEELYPKFVYRKVNLYLAKVTSMKKRSPHVLRHTFATHMLNNGADIHAIKEILGHSSLAATQVYTHNTIDKLKDIHRQAHPRG